MKETHYLSVNFFNSETIGCVCRLLLCLSAVLNSYSDENWMTFSWLVYKQNRTWSDKDHSPCGQKLSTTGKEENNVSLRGKRLYSFMSLLIKICTNYLLLWTSISILHKGSQCALMSQTKEGSTEPIYLMLFLRIVFVFICLPEIHSHVSQSQCLLCCL